MQHTIPQWSYLLLRLQLPPLCRLFPNLYFPGGDRISTDFCSQMLCGLLFPALVLWTGSSAWGWDPMLPGQGKEGGLQLRKPCGFSVVTGGCGSSPSLCPSYQCWCGFFCKSLVTRFLLASLFSGHSGWLLYTLLSSWIPPPSIFLLTRIISVVFLPPWAPFSDPPPHWSQNDLHKMWVESCYSFALNS